jgi:hypothetical protein
MNMSAAAIYRDVEVGLRVRLENGMRARGRKVYAAHPALAQTYARRVGRIAGGAAGVALGLALPAAAGFMAATGSQFDGGLLTMGLIAAVCVSVATTVAARAWAKEHAHGLLSTFEVSGNVFADIARLESEHPVAELHARTDVLERASIALPLVAFALLAPLSIHLLVAGVIVRGHFDAWMALSYALVGHAHLCVAFCGARLAKRLRDAEDLTGFAPREWKAYWLTVGVSAIPGAILIGIPPLMVAGTGLFFIPGLWGWAVRTVAHERMALR